MELMNKKEIEINGTVYKIPEIVLKEMKKMERENKEYFEFTEELKLYIYNYLGTNAKA